MLETLREFAAERLAASGEEAAVRDAHAGWFLALAERAEPGGNRPERDRGNCRAALAWAIERGDVERALRLAAAMAPVWLRYGPFSEGRDWIERALALGGSPPPRVRAAALIVLARIVSLQGDLAWAETLGEEALALARVNDDRLGTARALTAIGEAVDRQGDLDRSVRCHEEALALYREEGEQRGIAETLSHLAVVAWLAGDVDRFSDLAEEALALHRAIGDRTGLISALDAVSLAARLRGDLARQAALAGEMMTLCQEIDDPFVLGSALWTAAAIAGERGEHVASARIFGAAEVLREATGFVLDPAFVGEHERAVENLRKTLGAAVFAAAWQGGRVLGVPLALAEATAMLDRLAATSGAQVAGGSEHELTQRELDVLRLIVQGLTDREIADTLFIARRTASKHVESILSKLEVSSRGAAAAAALRLGLV
jgi:non-specific serine/threonine protein kinase